MGQRMDAARANRCQAALHVDAGGLQQRFAESLLRGEGCRGQPIQPLALDYPADQRKAVGVQPAGSEAEDHVALRDPVAGQDPIPFHGADGEAGEIVVAGAVHAGHFRRFATDQRAARPAAALDDAGNDVPGRRDVQFPGREVIQEDQRLRALDHQVVDAHGDKVDADGVVNTCGQRHHKLRAYPVGRCHHKRIAVAGGGGVEKSAESPQRGIGAGPHGATGQRLDGLYQLLASGYVHPGGAVVQPILSRVGGYGVLAAKLV